MKSAFNTDIKEKRKNIKVEYDFFLKKNVLYVYKTINMLI